MIRRSNGVEIPVEISHSYITTADGERLLLSVFHNISERKKMEEQLQEVQRMESVGALAEEIGNDFKNILGIVLNAAERLKNQVPATPEADECLEMITSASRRGGDLASDLLIFSRSDESDMMPILVNQNLEQAKTVLDRSLAPGIKVLVTAQNRSAAVRGNGRRLTQVIVNLCLSAQSRMQKGGTISVRSDIIDSSAVRKQFPAAAQADYIKISVTDDGLPLSDLDLRRIIEPYFSSHKGTRGAGLRLSVVHSIIRSHKGFMAAMNGKDGKTTFSVYLPVDHYEGEKERAALPEDYYFSGNELLLFVDDEEAFRQLMTVEFQRRGLRVITAADGEEALRLYKEKKNEIAIVVSDLSMPKMDGEELFSNLFALDPLVRFIFVTGNLEHQLKLDLLRRGVRDIVEKPFEFDKLVAAVQQVLAGL
ncbi:MAG: response regulator [Ignavibacteriales bacterium]|nr:response regulator [Ignavibacteriales bacterium]